MTNEEYISNLQKAFEQFKEESQLIGEDMSVEEWNDNFMLCLWEITNDKSRP